MENRCAVATIQNLDASGDYTSAGMCWLPHEPTAERRTRRVWFNDGMHEDEAVCVHCGAFYVVMEPKEQSK